MFKIGKEFHLLHVVSDLNAVDEWYDRVFSVRRFVRNYMKAAMRKASLVLIGDFVMEPAQPVKSEGWEKSALGKFYQRYGEHFHSIAWYVDDLRETSVELGKHKIRMFDMVGSRSQRRPMATRFGLIHWIHMLLLNSLSRRNSLSTRACSQDGRSSSRATNILSE